MKKNSVNTVIVMVGMGALLVGGWLMPQRVSAADLVVDGNFIVISNSTLNTLDVTGTTHANQVNLGERLRIGAQFSSPTERIFDSYQPGHHAYHYMPDVVVRRDAGSTNLHHTQAALALYNHSGTNHTWVKLMFASRSTPTGLPVSLAGLAAQRRGDEPGGWAIGDLVLWTKSGPAQQERMRIKGYNGNVGIGTENPTEKLDVAGNLKVSGSSLVDGDSEVTGWLTAYVPPQGGLSMGSYTNGPKPQ